MDVELSASEINRLASLLRDRAQDKKRRARQGNPNDREDMEASARADYELRKKLIGVKASEAEEVAVEEWSFDQLVDALTVALRDDEPFVTEIVPVPDGRSTPGTKSFDVTTEHGAVRVLFTQNWTLS